MGKFDVEKGIKVERSVFFFEYMPFPHSSYVTGNRVYIIIRIYVMDLIVYSVI